MRLLILPLTERLSDSLWGGEVPVAIFFFDAGAEAVTPDVSALFRATHGCTETETRVAMLYSDGATSAQIAAQFEVSPETIKTHLKRIFQKARVKNKAELSRLIQKLAAPVR